MIPISRWFPDSPLKLPFSLVLALKQAFFWVVGGGGFVCICILVWTSTFWEIDFLLYAIFLISIFTTSCFLRTALP